MRIVHLRAVVGSDRRLVLELPPEIPEGEVKVIVVAAPPDDRLDSEDLESLFREIDQMPRRRYTKEEIDRYLAEERASWG